MPSKGLAYLLGVLLKNINNDNNGYGYRYIT